jgi:hypothetical protein
MAAQMPSAKMNYDSPELARLEQVGSEEIPMPEEFFRRLGIASRPTFYRWERQGLRVLRVGGRRFIYPRDLRDFMEVRDAARRNR